MSELDKTVLHELFSNAHTIRVLGHLVVTRPFNFTLDELSKIDDLPPIELNQILDNLIDFDMIKYRHGKYSYGGTNRHSDYFEKFFDYLLIHNLERLSK